MEWQVRENQNGSSELYHYGVKGMKWGVRKDDDKTSSKKYRKDDKTINLKRDAGNKEDKTVRVSTGTAKTSISNDHDKDVDTTVIGIIAKADPNRYAPIEESQKKLDDLSRYRQRLSERDQIAATNHDRYNPMREINCFECSMAYEMRRRGYNVQAKEMNGGWEAEARHAFDIKDAFNVTITPDRSNSSNNLGMAKDCYEQIAKQCLTYGNGARGCLGIQYYDYDSGHSMAWVVEDGKFKIIDSQGLAVDGDDIFLHAKANVDVYRLDNAEILPGVMDFVEPFKPTNEEKEAAQKRSKQPNMAEAKEIKKKQEEFNKNRKERETVQRKAMAEMEANRSTVEKLVRKVKTVTNDLIAKGKRFLKNPLNIQTKKKATIISSNVTWEVR